jgi:DNA primase
VKQSKSQKESLGRAAVHYAKHIAGAEDYLARRGITLADAHTAHLGLVVEPLPGHEQFVNRLAIPYITPTGVVDIRFRSMYGEEPKYMGMSGTETRLYNVAAISQATDFIAVCEGEIDAITLTQKCGIPAIGVPGANSWKRHYSKLLQDFERIYVFADGDQPGSDFGKKLAREVQGVIVINMPDGEDVNSIFNKQGTEFFREKVAA